MNRSLLITGGAGFIGSNFVHYWINNYPSDKIVVLDLLSYAANKKSIQTFIDTAKIAFVKGNINDYDLTLKILRNYQITHIINFAAETHVDRSISSPDVFLDSNILGTYNLLKSFKKFWEDNYSPSNWRFLHVSTDEVFGSLEPNDEKFTELSPYRPRSPYSASKASSDHLVQASSHTFGLPTLITNCSNNYGPFQFPEKLIPLAITNLLRGKKIPIYGDGQNIRDWLFVEDHCSGIDAVLNRAKTGSSYCIGGENEVKNIDLINILCDLVDKYALEYNVNLKQSKSKALINYVDDRLGHDKRYAINSSKIFSDLQWQPKVKFEYGMQKTVKWYLKNRDWWEPLLIKK